MSQKTKVQSLSRPPRCRATTLYLGTCETTPASVKKSLKKLSGCGFVSTYYKAGPTGEGLS